MASYATTTSSQPADAMPQVVYGARSPGKNYRFTGFDEDRVRSDQHRYDNQRMQYDSFRNQERAGNVRYGTPGVGLPSSPSPNLHARWERDDDDGGKDSGGSAAKDPETRSAGQRPTPPPQSVRNALDRSRAYLDGTVRQARLDDTSNPNYYRDAGRTFAGNADRVDRRYARYFDTKANLSGSEIGFAGANAVAGLPDKLAMTEPMSPSMALAFAKDLSLIATGQLTKDAEKASPFFRA
jgi:hypothetical protein